MDLWFNSPHGGQVEGVELPLDRPLLYRGRKWIVRGPVRLYDKDDQLVVREVIEYRDRGLVEGAENSDTPVVLPDEEQDPPSASIAWFS